MMMMYWEFGFGMNFWMPWWIVVVVVVENDDEEGLWSLSHRVDSFQFPHHHHPNRNPRASTVN